MNVEQEVSGTMKRLSRKFGFSITTLLPVLLLSVQSPATEAQETDPAIYKCKQCVKYTGWSGVFDFGLGWVSGDSAGFGDYRGLDEEGFYAALDGDLHYRSLQGRYLDLYADNLGYESREFDIRGGNRGQYELRFGWQEIPRYLGYGTQTPFLGAGTDNLTLPDDWVKANTTSGMSTLDSNLVANRLKTKRKLLDAGGTVNFLSNWSYRIDYQRQKKEGTRTMGAGLYYSNSTILPTPVDYTTDLLDMALTWQNKRAQVELAFISSKFKNGDDSLTWENPFRSQPELNVFRAALEPENKFHEFSLSGAFAITPKIRLSGKAALGRMKQNDPFLPYTSNPLYSDLPLPRASLDGKVDTNTYNVAGKLFARLNNKFSFTARGKWDERDNKTPVDYYTAVITDLVPTSPRFNRPYSYKRQNYSADVRYRAHRVIRLSAGGRQENMDRTLQAVERTKETTWWGELKLNSSPYVQMRLRAESGDRDISDYLQPADGGTVNHPLMRKFNMADRDRNRYQIEFDFMVSESVGINLNYFYAKSDYDKSVIGLQKSTDQSFTINFNYAIGSRVNFYAFATRDDIDATILNTTGGSSAPWDGNTRDNMTTIGLGLSSVIDEKSSVGFDFVSSDSDGKISVQTAADEEPFAPLKTNLTNAKLHYDREINEHWGYKLYVEFEKYRASDWAIDGLGVDGINSVLTMGQQTPKYNIWYLRVQASYRF